MRISDWSSDVCSSDLDEVHALALRLDVVDDGHGVPEALAEQVFLPLVSGRAEGSGLGLALAQQVAREHRGSLAYRSRPGHTVFRSEEHTSELQSLMRISYAVFCLKKKTKNK